MYFCFGIENWSWSQFFFNRIKGWETKAMRRLFRVKKKEDETWSDSYTRTAKIARKIWTRMKLQFLSEGIAQSMWSAMGFGL